MKKTLLALTVLLAVTSSAFACSNSQPCSVPSSTGSSVSNAGSQTNTSASASSAGNGSAFSLNTASANGLATGYNTQSVGTNNITSVGSALVGGQASTSGSVYSKLTTTGNAEAYGSADAAACATTADKASYNVTGLQPISGDVSGSAGSTTSFGVATGSGPGTGLATASQYGYTAANFDANADSHRIGAGTNIANSGSTAGSTSYTAPSVNVASGNAGIISFGGTSGNAGSLSNATAGNLCTATSCANSHN